MTMDTISLKRNGTSLVRGAQLLAGPRGEIYARVESECFLVTGLAPESVRHCIRLIAHGTSPAEVEMHLSRSDGEHLLEAVNALSAIGVLQETPADRSGPPAPRLVRHSNHKDLRLASVAIIGNHVLLDTIADAFQGAGISHRTFYARHFESCRTEAIRSLDSEVVLCGSALETDDELAPAGEYECLDPTDAGSLSVLLRQFSFAICALEGLPIAALLDVNKAAMESGTPCLFVTAGAKEALIGPTVIGGVTACFACRAMKDIPTPFQRAMACLASPVLPPDSPLAGMVARSCVEEAAAVLGVPQRTVRAATILKIPAEGQPTVSSILPNGKCSVCGTTCERDQTPLGSAAAFAAAEQIGRVWPVSPVSAVPLESDSLRRIGILGGGTAGYLTALTLRAQRPELDVTLIESSKIPVIGVGEATTPELVKFLFSPRFLGRDIADFHERVRPTWKLGIKFEWGFPGEYYFTFPFQRGRMLESHLYDSTLNRQSLGAMLMAADRAPLLKQDDHVASLLHLVRWAYHLDNERFVNYLQQEAVRDGVHRIDAVISDAAVSPDGENILYLVTDDGRRLEYDLYIDCSGFRSFLLEQKLGSKFLSYGSTLFTDRALAARVPHNGIVKPYTLAETMRSGWCWNIPFEDSDHRGYVFSSAFSTPEQAEQEMRACNPQMEEPRLVKFRSGRHEHFWKGNVVAFGNAYAFVEPLESTAIHMLVLQLELLTTFFPASRRDEAVKRTLNRKIHARWDALRWFLGIHYKFNRRLQTPFWQAAGQETDISGAAERLELFQERAPLSYGTSAFYTVYAPEFFSDDHAYDTLLLGQKVPARYVQPVEDRETWRRMSGILSRTAATALGQHDALPYLREEGTALLYDFVHRQDSWLHTWLPA